MQISDYLFVDKVFQNLRQKLCLGSHVLDEKDQCIDLGIVYVNNNESISSSWAELQ